MICPVCRSDMIVVEHNRIELDYCTRCHGVWFDAGELEMLLASLKMENPDLFLGNILSSAEVTSSEKKRKCPICRQKMKKTIVGEQPKILIDVCQRGDGLWFDGGEIGQLIKQLGQGPSAKLDSQQQLLAHLGEVFKAREKPEEATFG